MINFWSCSGATFKWCFSSVTTKMDFEIIWWCKRTITIFTTKCLFSLMRVQVTFLKLLAVNYFFTNWTFRLRITMYNSQVWPMWLAMTERCTADMTLKHGIFFRLFLFVFFYVLWQIILTIQSSSTNITTVLLFSRVDILMIF